MKEWVKNLEQAKKKMEKEGGDATTLADALEACDPVLAELQFVKKYKKHGPTEHCTEESLKELMAKGKAAVSTAIKEVGATKDQVHLNRVISKTWS